MKHEQSVTIALWRSSHSALRGDNNWRRPSRVTTGRISWRAAVGQRIERKVRHEKQRNKSRNDLGNGAGIGADWNRSIVRSSQAGPTCGVGRDHAARHE
jgi:hypothetical protein